MPIALYIYIGISTVALGIASFRIRQLMQDVVELRSRLGVVENKTKTIIAEE